MFVEKFIILCFISEEESVLTIVRPNLLGRSRRENTFYICRVIHIVMQFSKLYTIETYICYSCSALNFT